MKAPNEGKRKDASQPLLTVKNVATRLQLSERSVHRLIAKGDLKAIHILGALRITEDAYQVMLKGAESP